MNRALLLCLSLLALSACGSGNKPPPPAAQAAQPTAVDEQLKALQKAKDLRDSHAEERKAELDARIKEAEGG